MEAWIKWVLGFFGAVMGFLFVRIWSVNDDLRDFKRDVDSRPDFETLDTRLKNAIETQSIICQKDRNNIILKLAHMEEDTAKITAIQENQTKKIDTTHDTVIEISTMLKTRKEERINT